MDILNSRDINTTQTTTTYRYGYGYRYRYRYTCFISDADPGSKNDSDPMVYRTTERNPARGGQLRRLLLRARGEHEDRHPGPGSTRFIIFFL